MTDPDTTVGVTRVHAHPAPQNTALAVASLVLGIIAICIVWMPIFGLIAWVLAPLGLVLGVIALARSAGSGRGVAIAGVVCSAIGLLGCILWIVGLMVLGSSGW